MHFIEKITNHDYRFIIVVVQSDVSAILETMEHAHIAAPVY